MKHAGAVGLANLSEVLGRQREVGPEPPLFAAGPVAAAERRGAVVEAASPKQDAGRLRLAHVTLSPYVAGLPEDQRPAYRGASAAAARLLNEALCDQAETPRAYGPRGPPRSLAFPPARRWKRSRRFTWRW